MGEGFEGLFPKEGGIEKLFGRFDICLFSVGALDSSLVLSIFSFFSGKLSRFMALFYLHTLSHTTLCLSICLVDIM